MLGRRLEVVDQLVDECADRAPAAATARRLRTAELVPGPVDGRRRDRERRDDDEHVQPASGSVDRLDAPRPGPASRPGRRCRQNGTSEPTRGRRGREGRPRDVGRGRGSARSTAAASEDPPPSPAPGRDLLAQGRSSRPAPSGQHRERGRATTRFVSPAGTPSASGPLDLRWTPGGPGSTVERVVRRVDRDGERLELVEPVGPGAEDAQRERELRRREQLDASRGRGRAGDRGPRVEVERLGGAGRAESLDLDAWATGPRAATATAA